MHAQELYFLSMLIKNNTTTKTAPKWRGLTYWSKKIMNTKKFHYSIDDAIIAKIEKISDFVAEKQLFLDNLSCVDLIDNDATKDYLEWQHRDGYMSYNRGGVELSLRLSSGLSSGFSLTKAMAKWQDRMRDNIITDFCNDLQIDNTDLFKQSDKILDCFYEYESDYLMNCDVAMVQFRIVIDDDTDLITLDLSICYDDEYFRGSNFEVISDLYLDFSQFERITLESIERFFKRAIKRA